MAGAAEVARAQRGARVDPTDRLERIERIDRSDRIERIERIARVDRIQPIERIDRPGRAGTRAAAALAVAAAAAATAAGAAAGLALTLLGSAWAGWAAWTLVRAGNPLRAGAAPRRFVDEGPFAFSRNPMAAGMVTATLGAGLALGQPLAGLAAAALLALWQRSVIMREEAELRRRFGGWYSDYAARVRRWI